MKHLIHTTLLLLTLYACSKSDRVVSENWANGNPKLVFDFKNRKDSTYTRTEYFETGKLKSTQDFVNGKRNGKVINYAEKGYKEQEFDFVNGQKNGIATAWYESGKIAFQFKVKDDLYYDGTEYYENGWPRVLVKFSAPGQRQGKAIYYEEDGHIWQQGYFKQGKEDSIWTTFDSTGAVTGTINYKDGEVIEESK